MGQEVALRAQGAEETTEVLKAVAAEKAARVEAGAASKEVLPAVGVGGASVRLQLCVAAGMGRVVTVAVETAAEMMVVQTAGAVGAWKVAPWVATVVTMVVGPRLARREVPTVAVHRQLVWRPNLYE